MRHRLHDALHHSSEIRALFVLIVLIALRAWRKVLTLRPYQMAMPAALLQIIIFVLAALTEHFILGFAVGNFMIAALIMLPVMLKPAEVKVHWVRPEE